MSVTEAVDIRYRGVVRPYAIALLKMGSQQGRTDPLIAELEGVCQLVEGNAPFAALLDSLAISRHDKRDSLKRIFDGRISNTLLGMMLVMCEHERLFLLPSVLDQLRQLHEQELGRRRVRVTSAVALSPLQQEAVRHRVAAALSADPLIDYEVEPRILGGLIVRIGDTLADASVRTRLRRMRDQIMVRSRNEIQS